MKKIFKSIVKSFDPETHRAKILISTGDKDRDNEVIEPGAFKKNLPSYMKHPVLLSSHRSDSLLRQIGRAHEITISDDGVEGDYEWFAGQLGPDGKSINPEADWGWFLVTRGIAAFSIGFMPKAWLDKWTQPMISQEDSARGITRRFTEIELFENSQVLVPANPNALQRRLGEAQGEEKELLELATKSLKEDEIKPFSDAEAAQEKARHDKAVVDFKSMIFDPSVKEDIVKIFNECLKKAIEEGKEIPKHYSEIILDAGASVPKQTPTDDAEDNAEEQETEKKLNQDALLGAIRSGVQEGIK